MQAHLGKLWPHEESTKAQGRAKGTKRSERRSKNTTNGQVQSHLQISTKLCALPSPFFLINTWTRCPMSTLSYSRGPDAPLLEKTIPQVLSEIVSRLPGQEALVVRHQKTRLTFRQLQQCVEEVARGLTGLGLQPGDRIGVWASGCVEWV